MQKKLLSKKNLSVGNRSRVSRKQKLRKNTRARTFKYLFKILEWALVLGKITAVIRELRK
jgi:hypothetical protein